MPSSVNLNLDFSLLNDHRDPFQVNDDELTLQQLIPRLIHEKGLGSFLNITEEELSKEIQNHDNLKNEETDLEKKGDFAVGLDNDGTKAREDEEDEENLESVSTNQALSTNEAFYKNKHEALKNIQTALNESSLALDFVSLLISCLRPAAATVSMSAHLKKFVDHGSLNTDRVEVQKHPEEKSGQMKETRTIGLGWKLSAFENSSTSLRDAGSRLAEEVFKEKLFWDTIKKNLNTKEILFKTRERGTNRKVLAVKFGYGDSGSTYDIEGNAIIKITNDGNNVQFIPIDNKPIINKNIRVRVLARDSTSTDDSDYQIVGESQVSHEVLNDSNDEDQEGRGSLKTQIEQARYFIFEEELFNQLLEESSTLISYNVKVENESKLTIEVNHQLIEITYQENLPSDRNAKEPRPQDQRAELIATYLRLMLTMKHRAHLNSKNQTKILKANPGFRQTQIQSQQLQTSLQGKHQEHPILKPLIGQFRHDFILKKLHNLLKRTLEQLNQSLPESNTTQIKFILYRNRHISGTPPVSRFKIIIPSEVKSRVFVCLESLDWVDCQIKIKLNREGERDKVFVFEDLRGGVVGGGVEGCLEWVITGLMGV